jgi:hypothetical protein
MYAMSLPFVVTRQLPVFSWFMADYHWFPSRLPNREQYGATGIEEAGRSVEEISKPEGGVIKKKTPAVRRGFEFKLASRRRLPAAPFVRIKA